MQHQSWPTRMCTQNTTTEAMHEVNLIFVLTTIEVRQVHFPVTLVKFLLLLHDIEIKN